MANVEGRHSVLFIIRDRAKGERRFQVPEDRKQKTESRRQMADAIEQRAKKGIVRFELKRIQDQGRNSALITLKVRSQKSEDR